MLRQDAPVEHNANHRWRTLNTVTKPNDAKLSTLVANDMMKPISASSECKGCWRLKVDTNNGWKQSEGQRKSACKWLCTRRKRRIDHRGIRLGSIWRRGEGEASCLCRSLGQRQFSPWCPDTRVVRHQPAIHKCLPSTIRPFLQATRRLCLCMAVEGIWPKTLHHGKSPTGHRTACGDIGVVCCQGWIQHTRGLFPCCLAWENVACDVDEALWPDPAQRRDAEAEWITCWLTFTVGCNALLLYNKFTCCPFPLAFCRTVFLLMQVLNPQTFAVLLSVLTVCNI